MWNYLFGKLRIGLPFKTLYLGFLSVLFGLITIGPVVVPLVNGEAIGGNIFLTILFAPMAVVVTKMTIESTKDMAVVPYWGGKFGENAMYKLLAGDRFSTYVSRDGKKCYGIKISESGRWMRIAGRYYPIPLIKGMSPHKAWTLVFINGETVEIPGLLGKRTAKALKEIFPPMITGTVAKPENDFYKYNTLAFDMAWDGPIEEMAHADWSEVRYAWEQKYAELVSESVPQKDKKKVTRDLIKEDVVYKLMFNRVMSDDEIHTVAEAVKCGRIDRPYALFDITNYTDEFCLCNAIKVLDAMGYPANREWIAFLFDCIKDVQKSYCNDAIAALRNNYPKEELTEHINAEIIKAHEENDLLWAAGLISLAKEIDYKISLDDNEADKDKEKEVTLCGTI